MRIAKSNIKDFGVWHTERENDVEIDMPLREYAQEVEQSITNYRDVLANVPMTDGHRARFERGLAMLEDVRRRLEEGGYKPKKEDLRYQKNVENDAYSLDNVEESTTLSEKKDAHPTRLQTSNDAQAVQRDAHLSDTKVETNSGNREEINENRHYLSAIVSERGDITRKAPWRSNPSQSQSEIPATNQGAVAKIRKDAENAIRKGKKLLM